jgi:hypothetical protein
MKKETRRRKTIIPNEILLANYGTNYDYDKMNPGFLRESGPDVNGGRDPRKCRRGR